jgi:hypothetical protein
VKAVLAHRIVPDNGGAILYSLLRRLWDKPRMPPPLQLPDDIEQRLIDGHRARATSDLMGRRAISRDEAHILVARPLCENLSMKSHRLSGSGSTDSSGDPFLRRRTDKRPDA